MADYTEAEYEAGRKAGYDREAYREYRRINDEAQAKFWAAREKEKAAKSEDAWLWGLLIVGLAWAMSKKGR